MSMTDKEVRQWYDAHGMEYDAEDWGPKGDNGESLGKQSSERARVGREYVSPYDPHSLYELEHDEGGVVRLLWEQREDHAVLEAVEEFFAPHMAVMPGAKRRVLEEYLLGRRSQTDMAGELGVSQQAVSKQLRSAVRWVVRDIADDQRFHAEVAGDMETASTTDDAALAWTAFNTFWVRKFGTPWPLRGE